jgi:hypothetical protein
MQAQLEKIKINHKVNMFTLKEDHNNDDHLNYKSSMLLATLSLHTKSTKKSKTWWWWWPRWKQKHINCDVNCDHLHYDLTIEIMQILFIHNSYISHTNIMYWKHD